MINMNSRGRFWAVVTSRFFLLIALVAIIIVVVALINGWRRGRELAQEVETLHDKISTYEKKNQELGELMTYFQTDDYAEREARLRLNLKLPGEQVVILPSDTANGQGGTEGNGGFEQNWQLWWNYFFKL